MVNLYRDKDLSEEQYQRLVRRLYSVLKSRARSRGIDFELTRDEVQHLTSEDCWYCGAPPTNLLDYGGSQLRYSGLDRLDAQLGYAVDNVVPCCRFCNSLRGTMGLARWASFICDLVSNWGGTPPRRLVAVAEPTHERAASSHFRRP